MKNEMTYEQFLSTVKVLKMLFGTTVAEKFWTKNIDLFYDINSESISKKEGS